MNEFQKQEIVSGNLPLKPFSMTAPHLTTNSFMKITPAVAVELVPNSSGSIDVTTFSKPDPLKKPVMGQVDIHNRFFFVRYPSVWKPFYDFIADTPHISGGYDPAIPSTVPSTNLVHLTKALLTYMSQDNVIVGVSQVQLENNISTLFNSWNADIVLYDVNSNDSSLFDVYGYKLSSRGRHVLSILKSLGYDTVTPNLSLDVPEDLTVSLMPLLCYVKVLVDWYYPSQFVNVDVTYVNAVRIIQRDYVYSLDDRQLLPLLDILTLHVAYNDDYFTCAFDNPVAPTNGAFSSYSLVDISLDGPSTSVTTNSIGTPLITPTSDDVPISSYSLEMLNSLSRFMRRHAISGARSLDRWLADYGLSIRADKLGRSIYLGSDKGFIQFGQTNATTAAQLDGVNQPLGDYSGNGDGRFAGNKHEFSSAEDFGMLFCMSSFIPSGGIVQGIRRHILHLNRLDFHNGEFDGKGVQAISQAEVRMDKVSSRISRVFGFNQRYSEYKVLRPMLSGDFICPSVNGGLDAWHTFRIFSETPNNHNLSISPNFILGQDSNQFGRMFYVTDPQYGEQFKTIYWVRIEMRAPMVQLSDDYVFHDSPGKKVTLQSNGTKLN